MLLPLWLKIAYTVFVAILVPVYWRKWGVPNFLWFSDIALLLALPALWLEDNLLASMMAISILIPETGWNISYFMQLFTGKRIFSLTDYMFDSSKSLFLRALSLFHVFLPPMLLYMVWKLGYNSDALFYQILLCGIVLFTIFYFTDKKENINWAFGPGTEPQTQINPLLYLLLLFMGFVVVIYLPTHFLLLRFY